jgi:hypothetical protein
MSSFLRKAFSVVVAALFAAVAMLQAEDWMRGAVVVTSVTGEVTLEETGGESAQMHPTDLLPRAVSGLLQIRTKAKNAVFLKTSNRISIYNEGAGFFAIERFEQDVATSIDQGKSRMIFNIRQGLLVVNNRALSEDSQMIVVTPLGRMSVKNGWWSLEIAYDERRHIYDCSIKCADGVLRFTDQIGETYTLRKGQRMRGTGTSTRASFKVAENAEEDSELFEEFALMEADAEALALSSAIFRSKMKQLKQVKQVKNAVAVTAEVSEEGAVKRPLVIEYAPQSAPVTPFRAVISAPTSYQADLF